MNKTNPIGVRFRADLLEKLKTDHGVDSPQKALVFYEKFYAQHHSLTKDVAAPLRASSPKGEKKPIPPAPKNKADMFGAEYHEVPKKPSSTTLPATIDKKWATGRIKELEDELKSPPKNPLIGLTMWKRVREQEISNLKKQLQ